MSQPQLQLQPLGSVSLNTQLNHNSFIFTKQINTKNTVPSIPYIPPFAVPTSKRLPAAATRRSWRCVRFWRRGARATLSSLDRRSSAVFGTTQSLDPQPAGSLTLKNVGQFSPEKIINTKKYIIYKT